MNILYMIINNKIIFKKYSKSFLKIINEFIDVI